MGRVLVVDDDAGMRTLLRRALGREGHDVTTVPTGTEAIVAATASPPDLVVLDLGLPDIDGANVLAAIAAGVRVLVLSAEHGSDRRVLCFERGAVDYVEKPFALRELLARVRMRAAEAAPLPAAERSTLQVGRVVVDLARSRVLVGDEPIPLSRTEFRVLAHLVRNETRVCTREELLVEIWGYAPAGSSNVVDVTMRRLRKKLGEADIIETVRHAGYCVG